MCSEWQEAYNSCGYKYLLGFCPQKPPPKSELDHQLQSEGEKT